MSHVTKLHGALKCSLDMFSSGRDLAQQYISALDNHIPRVNRLLEEQVVGSATELELLRVLWDGRLETPPQLSPETISGVYAWVIQAQALSGSIQATVYLYYNFSCPFHIHPPFPPVDWAPSRAAGRSGFKGFSRHGRIKRIGKGDT